MTSSEEEDEYSDEDEDSMDGEIRTVASSGVIVTSGSYLENVVCSGENRPYTWSTSRKPEMPIHTGSAYWGLRPNVPRGFSMGMGMFGLRDVLNGYGRFSPEQTNFPR